MSDIHVLFPAHSHTGTTHVTPAHGSVSGEHKVSGYSFSDHHAKDFLPGSEKSRESSFEKAGKEGSISERAFATKSDGSSIHSNLKLPRLSENATESEKHAALHNVADSLIGGKGVTSSLHAGHEGHLSHDYKPLSVHDHMSGESLKNISFQKSIDPDQDAAQKIKDAVATMTGDSSHVTDSFVAQYQSELANGKDWKEVYNDIANSNEVNSYLSNLVQSMTGASPTDAQMKYYHQELQAGKDSTDIRRDIAYSDDVENKIADSITYMTGDASAATYLRVRGYQDDLADGLDWNKVHSEIIDQTVSSYLNDKMETMLGNSVVSHDTTPYLDEIKAGKSGKEVVYDMAHGAETKDLLNRIMGDIMDDPHSTMSDSLLGQFQDEFNDGKSYKQVRYDVIKEVVNEKLPNIMMQAAHRAPSEDEYNDAYNQVNINARTVPELRSYFLQSSDAVQYREQAFEKQLSQELGSSNIVHQDSKGNLEVGINHKVVTGDHLKEGDIITQKQIDQFFKDDFSYTVYTASLEAEKMGIYNSDFIVALADADYSDQHHKMPGALPGNFVDDYGDVCKLITNGQYTEAAALLTDSDWMQLAPADATRFQTAILKLNELPKE